MPRRDGNKKGSMRTRAHNAQRRANIREHDRPSVWKGKQWFSFWNGESFFDLAAKGLKKGKRPE